MKLIKPSRFSNERRLYNIISENKLSKYRPFISSEVFNITTNIIWCITDMMYVNMVLR